MKKFITIGCCGIDCGLCPRLNSNSESACPGCGASNFMEKHPSCGFLTCCNVKNGLEVCSDCNDFPCKRFDKERQGFDSFLTHRKVFDNLNNIKSHGMDSFIEQQKLRINILRDLLTNFDDGRSKSYFCICCTLLPLDKLLKTYDLVRIQNENLGVKEKNKLIKERFNSIAESLNIVLKLNNR